MVKTLLDLPFMGWRAYRVVLNDLFYNSIIIIIPYLYTTLFIINIRSKVVYKDSF